uniref:Legume lectin domain-containing protein n=1 Tax=Oryza nivara TaxID=4536 RepID=A0A0E0GXD9_ORYNI
MPHLHHCAGYLLLLLLLSVSLDASHLTAAAAAPAMSFSFNFSDPSTDHHLDELNLEGDATPQDGLVNLTCSYELCYSGRMTYAHPVQLYHQHQAANGRDELEVASFFTSFTFAIRPVDNGTTRGDGMAFFLAGYPSKVPPKSAGGNLGLVSEETKIAVGSQRFIAVEFDTVNNSFDPAGVRDHIGIDINSVRDPGHTKPCQALNGTMTASIAFNSSTQMLVASLVFHDHPSQQPVEVSAQLPDLVTALLPPQVAVGFSAANAASVRELNQILTWSFNSTLALVDKDFSL